MGWKTIEAAISHTAKGILWESVHKKNARTGLMKIADRFILRDTSQNDSKQNPTEIKGRQFREVKPEARGVIRTNKIWTRNTWTTENKRCKQQNKSFL